MKKLLALLLALSLVCCLACTAAPKEEKTFRIGVIQLTEHAALDSACQGFIDTLEASGLPVEIDVQNAQG